MSVAKSRRHEILTTAPVERASFFKDDHPRRIDQYISFFGDEDSASTDPCGDALLEVLSDDRWAQQS